LFCSLRSPNLPEPSLRRELDCFPTILQDILANEVGKQPASTNAFSFGGFGFDDAELEILRQLDEKALDLLHEFDTPFENHCLVLSKWMAKPSRSRSCSGDKMDIESSSEEDLFNSASTRSSDRLPLLEMTYACKKTRKPKTFVVSLFKALERSVKEF
jgi:hypothetical protein